EISDELYNESIEVAKPLDIPEIPELVVSPRYAFNAPTVSLPLRESIGQISAEFLMAYPPGIPVLCPGERITMDIIDYVEKMKEANLSIQGTEDPEANYIKVVNYRQALNVIA
ncbi:MAG: arginine decarboxylase, partial [Caldanaerobacter sp.]